MTSSHSRDPVGLRERLRRSTAAADYDVEAGLMRHRRLIREGAPLPEWAGALPGAPRRFGQLWLLASLAVLGAVSLLLWRSQPSPQSARAPSVEASSPETLAPQVALDPPSLAAEQGAARSASTPVVQPLVSALPLQATAPSVALRGAAAPTPAQARAPTVAPMRAPSRAAVRAPAALHEPLAPTASQAVPAPLPHELVAELAAGSLRLDARGGEALSGEPAAPRSPAPDAIDPEVIEEMQQLATAERLLTSMPSRTLSMVREGMQRFPRGYLAQERRYLEIMALLALRMPKDAELLSRGFLRDYPNGPYRRKIERALERGAAE
ncbi:MAG TPA: hypothetical protein VFZ61_15935 [Polyangiales bacterium]